MTISIYGPLFPDDWRERQREKERAEKYYEYLKSKINAEKLNPNYSTSNRLKLLSEVGSSICDYYQRKELINMLALDDEDFDGE